VKKLSKIKIILNSLKERKTIKSSLKAAFYCLKESGFRDTFAEHDKM